MSQAIESRGEDVAQAQAALQQLTNGYWTTQIVYVAAKLRIADLVKDSPLGLAALAQATETHAPSLYRLMRALAGLGVFMQNEDGNYEATALGRCLVSGSPGALRARAILNGEEWYTAWGDLLHSVRTGETAFDHVYGMPVFEHLAANPDTAATFNESMVSSTDGMARAVADAYDFSGLGTIVDVGGGTGTFLAGILKANAQARGVLFDQPAVVAAAGTLLSSVGVADRCEVVAGDFFEAVPVGGDAYILSFIIHDWDDDRSVAILKSCRRAMADDARLLLIEQVVPPGNQPSLSKLYDIHMLALAGGHERREDEYRSLLEAADLQLERVVPTEGPRSVLVALPR
jgi:hypothetical protein